MKIKRISAAVISVVIFFCLAACKADANKPDMRAEALKSEAVKLIGWYKNEKAGESADLSELSASVEDTWSGASILCNADISVIGFAKYYGLSADYDAYFTKLETAFNEIYADKESVKSASPATLYILMRTLVLLDKNPRDFCGVDLIKAATTENTSFKSVYSTPYVLTVLDMWGLGTTEKSLVDSTVDWLFSEQHSDGGWGYEDFYTGEAVTDPDATAMVLAGLAPFVPKDNENIVRAWYCLKSYKTESGVYRSSYSDGSADTTSEVLTAVAAAGKNPYGEEFTTDGKNLIDIILSFRNEDGGLRPNTEDAPSSDITVQNALDAFYRTSVYLAEHTSADGKELFEVYLSVSCANVFLPENDGRLDSSVKEILPSSGIIFESGSVKAENKQTVYALIVSVLRENKIHCESSNGYVKGINNLYEKACGADSGWVFLINGEFSSAGANSVYVKENDRIEWLYSVEKGDVSGGDVIR